MAISAYIQDERDAIMTWHEIDHFTTSFNGTGTVVIRSFANGATFADETKARKAGDSTKDLSLNTFSVQVPEGTEISRKQPASNGILKTTKQLKSNNNSCIIKNEYRIHPERQE